MGSNEGVNTGAEDVRDRNQIGHVLGKNASPFVSTESMARDAGPASELCLGKWRAAGEPTMSTDMQDKRRRGHERRSSRWIRRHMWGGRSAGKHFSRLIM